MYTRRGIRNVFVNTPSHTWVYTRTRKKEKKRSVTRTTWAVSPMKRDLSKYIVNKNGLRNILTETTVRKCSKCGTA
jgi:ribosomal protein L34E